MGAGIAQVSALSGKFNSIVLQDVDEKALEKAKKTIGTSLERIQKKNRECFLTIVWFDTFDTYLFTDHCVV